MLSLIVGEHKLVDNGLHIFLFTGKEVVVGFLLFFFGLICRYQQGFVGEHLDETPNALPIQATTAPAISILDMDGTTTR